MSRTFDLYRFVNLGQALMYVALAGSVWLRPPTPLPGQQTVFDYVIDSGWCAVAFLAVGVLLGIAAVTASADLLGGIHATLIAVMLGYGVANLGISLHNGTGWQIAALAGALVFGHANAILSRPLLDAR